MSQRELQRVKVMENAAGGRLSVREASCLLHCQSRLGFRVACDPSFVIPKT